MAATDRTTGRIIAKLKHKVAALTALTVVLAIALGVMTYLYVTKDGEEKGAVGSSSAIASSNEEDVASVSSNPTAEEKAAMALALDLDNWNLRLVNGKKPLPSGFTVETEKIEATYARDVGMLYDARAVSYLNAMCAAAERDGINLLVISSFRTNERQTALYNNQVTKQKALHPELSQEEINKLAGTISAYPGTSEHEVGLAVDFNSVEESFENTAEFQWLKTNAADYGFVLRYAKEKQDITGVIYEPWHYRYVGEKHAKKINELGYCLEEYIEYLNKITK